LSGTPENFQGAYSSGSWMAGYFPLLRYLHPSSDPTGKDCSSFSGRSLDPGVSRAKVLWIYRRWLITVILSKLQR